MTSTSHTPTRRRILAGTGALLAAPSLPARAQAFPSKAVTIVVPYPAGGSVDVVARILGEAMTADLGQPVVIENKGGASGSIGTAAVARADADGHTIVLGTQQTHATNPAVVKALTYDPVRDFVPVLGLAVVPHLLVTKKALGVASVAALIEAGKAKAGGLTFGSTGIGSASHLAAAHFNQRAGLATAVHLPFRGAAPLVQELLAGNVDYAIASLPSVLAQVQSGDLKGLAVVRNRRLPLMGDLPALAEAGFADVDADAWFAMFAPAKTPDAAVARLSSAITKAIAIPAVAQKLQAAGVEVVVRPGSEIAAALPSEVKRWADVAAAANVKPE
jgi:tripartite-type tricarboxylate transporter receptor subunit TctC